MVKLNSNRSNLPDASTVLQNFVWSNPFKKGIFNPTVFFDLTSQLLAMENKPFCISLTLIRQRVTKCNEK